MESSISKIKSNLKLLSKIEEYPNWKIRAKAALLSSNLWNSKANLPLDEDMAAAFIINIIDNEFLDQLVDSDMTASTIWKHLDALANKADLSTQTTALMGLISYNFDGPNMLANQTKMEDLLRRTKSAFGNVQSISIDELGILFALVGLPNNYFHVRTQLLASASTGVPLTVRGFYSHLIREETALVSSTSNLSVKANYSSATTSFPTQVKSSTTGAKCEHKRIKTQCWKCTPASRPKCSLCTALGLPDVGHKPESPICELQRLKAASKGSQANSIKFLVDSGATDHIVSNKDAIQIYKNGLHPIKVASDSIVFAKGCGTILTSTIPLENVLHCPSISENLLSTPKLAANGYSTLFIGNEVLIGRQATIGEVVLRGTLQNGSYYVNVDAKATTAQKLADWHNKLGHRHQQAIKDLKLPGVSQLDQLPPCEPCLLGKAKHGSHPKRSEQKSKKTGDMIHVDICGPLNPVSIGGHRYFLTITDDFSRFVKIYLMKLKSEAQECLVNFATEFFTATEYNIKVIHSDNGAEFRSIQLQKFCQERGIGQIFTVRHSPSQNGIAERLNQTLLNSVRASLNSSKLTKELWDEALLHSTFAHNLLPASNNPKLSPYQLYHGVVPNYEELQAFGTNCYATIPSADRLTKLSNRAVQCKFLGYAIQAKGYRLLVGTQILTSRIEDVIFQESLQTPEEIANRHDSASSEDGWTFITSGSALRQAVESPTLLGTNMYQALSSSPDLEEVVSNDLENHQSASPDVSQSAQEIVQIDAPGNQSGSPAIAGNTDPLDINPFIIHNQNSVINPSTIGQNDEEYSLPRPEKVYKTPGWGKWKITEVGPIKDPVAQQSALPAKRTRKRINYEENPNSPSPAESDPQSKAKTTKSVAYRAAVMKTLSALGTVDSIVRLTNHGDHQWLKSKAYAATVPNSYNDIASSDDSEEWYKASDDEISQMIKFGVWKLVPAPPGVNIMKNRWVYRIKEKDGVVTRFKARLCACGYSQVAGIDYNELFAPTVQSSSLRLELILVAQRKMHTKQLDVTGAFLNGTPQETLYMDQPEGFVDQEHPNWVCLLLRNLYGLKQAPRVWHLTVDPFIKSLGFVASADPCLYVRWNNTCLSLLALHVDDITLSSDSKTILEEIGNAIKKKFDVTDDGEISEVLKIKITRDIPNQKLFLSQSNYIKQALQNFNLHEANIVNTPMEANTVSSADCPLLGSEAHSEMSKIPYREACGTLMSLAINTRPDISYSVGVACRFMHNPGLPHWNLVKRIFKYLKGTMDYQLCLGGSIILNLNEFRSTQPHLVDGQSKFNSRMFGLLDADWSGDRDNSRSTTGYSFFLGSSLLSWASRLQATAASSTTHAEYYAAYHSTTEALWLQKLLISLQLLPGGEPTILFSDNSGAIQLGKHHMVTQRSKHFSSKLHLVRDTHQSGAIKLTHIPTSINVSDIFTKPLPRKQFEFFRENLGLVNPLKV